MNLSPLDDRYRSKIAELLPVFSEFGLARARTIVEVRWLQFLSKKGIAPKIKKDDQKALEDVIEHFGDKEFGVIKDIEKQTNHDVKAVELFLRQYVNEELWSWIHFGCTSEDINNTAYALLFRDGREIVTEALECVLDDLFEKIETWKAVPMLSRTHGQTATPSTMGKELAVFYLGMKSILGTFEELPLMAKINGATGTFAAHVAAFPKEKWIEHSQEFIEKYLELDWNPVTTQIEPHDGQAAILNEVGRLSTVMIDLCRDVWGYISLGYFGQKVIKGEVGSSTMPHKVNPIDFENAEGNLKLCRNTAQFLANELPISRWQRDLTDSTLQRNFGLVFGHFLLALKSLKKGLGKLELKEDVLLKDLQESPEVLTEAVQTVLRAHGHADAYEQLKVFSRGKKLTLPDIHSFINQADLPEKEKKRLLELKPEDYTGLAEELVDQFVE